MNIPLSTAIEGLAAARLASGLDPDPAAAELQAVRDTFTVLARGDIVATEGVDPGPRAVDRSVKAEPAVALQEPPAPPYVAAPGVVSAPVIAETGAVREIHASDALRVGMVEDAAIRFGIPPLVWRLAQFWRREPARPIYLPSLNVVLADVTHVGSQFAVVFDGFAVLWRTYGGARRIPLSAQAREGMAPWLFADVRVDAEMFYRGVGPTLEGRELPPLKTHSRGERLPPPGGEGPDAVAFDAAVAQRTQLVDAMLVLRAGLDPHLVTGPAELHGLDVLFANLFRHRDRGDDRPRKPAIRRAVLAACPAVTWDRFDALWETGINHREFGSAWRPGRPRKSAGATESAPPLRLA